MILSSPKSNFYVCFHGVIGSIASPRLSGDIEAKIQNIVTLFLKQMEEEAEKSFANPVFFQDPVTASEAVKNLCRKMAQKAPSFLSSLPLGQKGTYGGNTSCVEVGAGREKIILDAGTGIRACGEKLMKGEFGQGQGKALLLLSHTHIDHIVGWPFFVPAYIKGNSFEIWGPPMKEAIEEKSLEEVFKSFMQWYFFPVPLHEMGASFSFRDIAPGVYQYGDVKIEATRLYHPVWSLGFRIEFEGKVVVYETDSEYYSVSGGQPEGEGVDAFFLEVAHRYNASAVKLARNADIFICDAQYLPEEYAPEMYGLKAPGKKGWGHSTYEHAVLRAKEAQAKRLVLFHHEPEHSDALLDEKTEKARAYARKVGYEGEIIPAYEGLTLEL